MKIQIVSIFGFVSFFNFFGGVGGLFFVVWTQPLLSVLFF